MNIYSRSRYTYVTGTKIAICITGTVGYGMVDECSRLWVERAAESYIQYTQATSYRCCMTIHTDNIAVQYRISNLKVDTLKQKFTNSNKQSKTLSMSTIWNIFHYNFRYL